MNNQKRRIQKFVSELSTQKMTEGQTSFFLVPNSVFGEASNVYRCKNLGPGCMNSENSKACTNEAEYCEESDNKKECLTIQTECDVNFATQDGCNKC